MTPSGGVRCRICELEYWKGFTHCPQCHRTWTALGECHCASCHRHFTSDSVFRAHQVADVCRDPAGMLTDDGAPRFRAYDRPSGVAWGWNHDEPRPARAGE